jgi:hypothetical protein
MIRKTSRFAVAALVAGAFVSPARAAILTVGNHPPQPFQCQSPQYQTINAALAAAKPGDTIQVCPGTYPEQVVLTESIVLTGVSFGQEQPIIEPTSVPTTRPSLLGDNPVAAAILVDGTVAGTVARISHLVIDLKNVNVASCLPFLAGVYLRAASGFIDTVTIQNVRVAGDPTCNSGVGLYIESGQTGEVLGIPTITPARVNVLNSQFTGYQKAGLVANGPRTIVTVKGGQAVGGGATVGAVQYGYQIGYGAKANIAGVTTSQDQSLLAGKAAAGVLVFDGVRVSVRKGTMSNSQEGVLGVADGVRVKKTSFSDMTGDGIVFIGNGNIATSNLIEGSGVSGVFIKGGVNIVRGGVIRNQSIGIWFQTGSQNKDGGVQFEFVPVPSQVISGGVRWAMTEASAVPFTTECTTAADCANGNSCSTAACAAGHCTFTSLAPGSACNDGNPCSTGVCNATGVCQGTLLPQGTACNDNNSCTTGDACSAAGVCVGTQVAAGTACNDGNACTGTDTCNNAGVCVGTPLAAGTACDDGNACTTSDACNGTGVCIGVVEPTGTACTSTQPCTTGYCSAASCLGTPQPPGTACNDGNACTTNDVCAAGAVCAGTPVADGTACGTAMMCHAGVCS